MKTAIFICALMVAEAMADGFGHNHRNAPRSGRRGFSSRQGRRGFPRRGRQDAALGNYGEAATEAPEVLPPPGDYDYPADAAPLGSYGAEGALDQYASASDAAADPNLAMLEKAVPGIPGEDYPIFAEVPESGFSCEGQVDGGYYADPEAQCQVFHICTADGQGGLAKYSFLCPNGTIFNQNYFICDWWFNFDCAEAENLYSLNDDIAAERDAASGAQDSYGAPGGAQSDYAGPTGNAAPADYSYDYEVPADTSDYVAPVDYGTDYAAAPSDYAAGAQPEYAATEAAPTEAPGNYGAPGEEGLAADPGFLPTEVPALGTYEGEESREARRFRGRGGRRNNGRRGGRGRNSRRQGRNRSFRNRNGRRNGRRQQGRRGRNFRG